MSLLSTSMVSPTISLPRDVPITYVLCPYKENKFYGLCRPFENVYTILLLFISPLKIKLIVNDTYWHFTWYSHVHVFQAILLCREALVPGKLQKLGFTLLGYSRENSSPELFFQLQFIRSDAALKWRFYDYSAVGRSQVWRWLPLKISFVTHRSQEKRAGHATVGTMVLKGAQGPSGGRGSKGKT